MKVKKSEESPPGSEVSNIPPENLSFEDNNEKGYFDAKMLSPEWLFTQVALKALLDTGNIEYVKNFAEAATIAAHLNGSKFPNLEGLVSDIKNDLDKYLSDKLSAAVNEKNLQGVREAFEREIREKNEALERSRQELTKAKATLEENKQSMRKEREQQQAKLEIERHELEANRLRIEMQNKELAEDRELLQKQQEAQELNEKVIHKELEKQAHGAFFPVTQPNTLKKMSFDERIKRECQEKLILGLKEAKLERDIQKLEKLRKFLENEKITIEKEENELDAQRRNQEKQEFELEELHEAVLFYEDLKAKLQDEEEKLKKQRSNQNLDGINLVLNDISFTDQRLPDAAKLFGFFRNVSCGDLNGVSHYLKENKAYVIARHNIKDLSGREFKKISALQYAYWAMDIEMCKLILKYLTPEEARDQLIEFERERTDITGVYGVHFSLQGYLRALKEYLGHEEGWYKLYINGGVISLADYWCLEIGQVQRGFPAWMIMLMGEEGDDAKWIHPGYRLSFERDINLLKSWFVQDETHHLGAKPNPTIWWSDPECGYSWVRGGDRRLSRWTIQRSQWVWGSYASKDYELASALERECLLAVDELQREVLDLAEPESMNFKISQGL